MEHVGEHACLPARLPPLLAWAGGKQQMVRTLCLHLPPHRVYVEPFAGGASLFWAKVPAEVEVLSDVDCRLIEFYKAVREAGSLEELIRWGWKPSRERFSELKACLKDPRACELDDPIFRAYAFLYVNKFGYGGKMGNPTYNPAKEEECEGRELCGLYKVNRRWEEVRDRLRHAVLLCADFREVIPRYDSPETFFFLDPPYWDPRHGGSDPAHYASTSVTPWEVEKAVRGLKGKFLLTYNDHPDVRGAFQGYHMREVATLEEMGRYVPATGERRPPRAFRQLLISNYPLIEHE